tara:strand:+ start:775 stop:1350 length:576 start_codon:yes stop_codon:yes gene_type:complete
MFRKLIFLFLLVFFVSAPAYAEDAPLPWLEQKPEAIEPKNEPDKLTDSERVEQLILIIEASLQCQVAAELTRNYYVIYLGFKKGLEKVDVTDMYKNPPPSLQALMYSFQEYEKIVVKIKSFVTAADKSVDMDKIEAVRYAQLRQMFIAKVLNTKLKVKYIKDVMGMNKECFDKIETRNNHLNKLINKMAKK